LDEILGVNENVKNSDDEDAKFHE